MKRKEKLKDALGEGILEILLTALFFGVGFGIFALFGGVSSAVETDVEWLTAVGVLAFALIAGSIIFVCRRIRRRLRVAIHSGDGLSLVPMRKKEFEDFYRALCRSFVWEETRERDDAYATLSNPRFTVYRILDNDRTVGYITLWRLSRLTFVEHFFIFEAYRSHGYGARVMAMAKKAFGPLILEVEPPEASELAARRVGFYERCGFHLNDCPYAQPSFHQDAPVPLMLMTCPERLSNPSAAVEEIYEVVYGIRKG